MKTAFCTCVQIGLSCIESVLDIGGSFDLFITLNDNKAKNKSGRVYLDELAKKTGTPIIKINHVNDQETIDALGEYEIDWLFIIGWSQIASKNVLEAPKKGVIGAHPSLLPAGRGRAAVPWAILKGLDRTGISFFKMDEGVDTGLILSQEVIELEPDETATILYNKVNKAHETLIKKIWPSLITDSIKGIEQDESKASYWEGRKPEDGEIERAKMTRIEVDKLVRATTRPYPGAFIQLPHSLKKIIWRGSLTEVLGAEKLELKDGTYYILESSIE
jgi:methionyl-tRNA formyltransferase